MTERLRDRVWWPRMDKEAKELLRNCRPCLLVSQGNNQEPMSRRQLPTGPWTDLALDFLGPLPTGEYLLVIVDYYSRYKIVKIMTRIQAKDVVTVLRTIFEDQIEGYPHSITLDNGRQLVATDLVNYCKSKGIVLNHTTLYWPQANGQVERQNRSLLKRLRISHLTNRDWREDLRSYLMMYNTTPHSVTKKPPAVLQKGRKIRTEIPSIHDLEFHSPPMDDIRDRDTVSKAKGKENEDARRHAKESGINEGDTVVIMNQTKKDKLTATFADEDFEVLNRTGNRLRVKSKTSGVEYDRAVAHAKKVPSGAQQTAPEDEEPGNGSPPKQSSFRPVTTSTPVPVERPKRMAKRPSRYDN